MQTAAIQALQPYLVGRLVEDVLDDLGGLSRELVHDSQLRWLGPEKGVMHMAISAVVNALWDLKAKRAGLPLWQLLSSHVPGGARRPRRLPVSQRRPDAAAGPAAAPRQ